jgi:hypothetical protein
MLVERPIVETPQNAIESFLHMDIDFLALDNYLISKKKNIRTLGAVSDQEFIKKRRDQFKVSFNSYLNDYKIHNFDFSFRNVYPKENIINLKSLLKSNLEYLTKRLSFLNNLFVSNR